MEVEEKRSVEEHRPPKLANSSGLHITMHAPMHTGDIEVYYYR